MLSPENIDNSSRSCYTFVEILTGGGGVTASEQCKKLIERSDMLGKDGLRDEEVLRRPCEVQRNRKVDELFNMLDSHHSPYPAEGRAGTFGETPQMFPMKKPADFPIGYPVPRGVPDGLLS